MSDFLLNYIGYTGYTGENIQILMCMPFSVDLQYNQCVPECPVQRPLVLGVVFLRPADVAELGVVEAASLSGFLQLQGVQALDGTSDERNGRKFGY